MHMPYMPSMTEKSLYIQNNLCFVKYKNDLFLNHLRKAIVCTVIAL